MGNVAEVMVILEQQNSTQKHASADLLPILYEELRRLAAQKLSLERPGQTLQATALVHEAWLRLMKNDEQRWESRGHFFAAAAEAMRRILVERARRKGRLIHGGGMQRVDLDGIELPCPIPADEVLALDEALARLEKLDPQGAEVVKLRFFAGLTEQQVAVARGVSLSTVERSWAFSRVWLYEQIRGRRRPE